MSGTTIGSSAFNTLETDIGTEITNSLDRNGRSAMAAALPMGNNKITGMADPTVSTDGATKNYVDTTTSSFFSTGDVKFSLKVVADTGWVLFDDGTFGSATSGASTRANSDTQALFTLFFNNLSDANAPLLTSGGGATTRAGQTNAATAWAANCRMSLPKTLGRALAVAGGGAGLSGRALGLAVGAETNLIAQANLPNVNFAVTDPGHTHGAPAVLGSNGQPLGTGNTRVETTGPGADFTFLPNSWSLPAASTGISVNSGGSGSSLNNMQPTVFLSCMIKL